jgi:virginiamycin B lyase
MVNTTTHAMKEWPTPSTNAGPYGIAIGPDGRIWFDEARTSLMVVFDPRTEQMETIPIPTTGAIVRNIAVDPVRRRIWLALSGTGRIGMIDLGAE